LLELLGLESLPGNVRFTREATEKTEGGLLVTRLTYRNVLGEDVPAVLIEPAGSGSRRLGGIVCMSGTSGTAERVADPRFYRPKPHTGPLIGWGRELARRGFVTLSPTLRGTTARAIGNFQRERLVAMLAPYGRSLNGVMVDEALRGVRILAAGARVDPQRIGLAGMSLGGGVAWYAMACDPSIRTAVPICGSVGSMAAAIHGGSARRHGSHWFVAHMLRYFDFPQIVAACIAPRPFMFVGPTMDEDMPRAGVDELIREVRPVYEAAGHPERFKSYQPDTKHVFLNEYFEWMAGWFQEYC
jgi:dienelactone hydrolase